MDQTERIMAAAIHYTDETKSDHSVANVEGLVISGHRHHQVIGIYKKTTGKNTRLPQAIQGFLTTKNRFVSREDAARIAHSAGQIDMLKEKLYSEDLW